jgi:hypothetical protein
MAWITVKGSAFARGLEPTFQEAMRGLDGTWTIEVHDGLVGGWWLLVIRRDDHFERTLLVSPSEQTPALLHHCIREAFRTVPPRPGASVGALPPGVISDRRASPRR